VQLPMNTLIQVAELTELLEHGGLLLFDCRFSLQDPAAGRRAWQAGHLPGAYFADMNKDLSSAHQPGKTGRHPLPVRRDWQARLQQWGLDPSLQVVAYDDGGGAAAARLWWMLLWAGHDKVAVLDGGLQAWLAAGLPLETATPAAPAAATFDYKDASALVTLVQAEELDASRQVLLDAREPARFRGEIEPIDPVAGHIPGARCSPFSANLDAQGYFRSPQELRDKFASAGTSTRPVVCYCGSGVTACHNILAMAHAGLPVPALYAGSWSEWITDPARGIATGE
jgi:thiosulfate/3-mercaptopyruvate sulfurtransferase